MVSCMFIIIICKYWMLGANLRRRLPIFSCRLVSGWGFAPLVTKPGARRWMWGWGGRDYSSKGTKRYIPTYSGYSKVSYSFPKNFHEFENYVLSKKSGPYFFNDALQAVTGGLYATTSPISRAKLLKKIMICMRQKRIQADEGNYIAYLNSFARLPEAPFSYEGVMESLYRDGVRLTPLHCKIILENLEVRKDHVNLEKFSNVLRAKGESDPRMLNEYLRSLNLLNSEKEIEQLRGDILYGKREFREQYVVSLMGWYLKQKDCDKANALLVDCLERKYDIGTSAFNAYIQVVGETHGFRKQVERGKALELFQKGDVASFNILANSALRSTGGTGTQIRNFYEVLDMCSEFEVTPSVHLINRGLKFCQMNHLANEMEYLYMTMFRLNKGISSKFLPFQPLFDLCVTTGNSALLYNVLKQATEMRIEITKHTKIQCLRQLAQSNKPLLLEFVKMVNFEEMDEKSIYVSVYKPFLVRKKTGEAMELMELLREEGVKPNIHIINNFLYNADKDGALVARLMRIIEEEELQSDSNTVYCLSRLLKEDNRVAAWAAVQGLSYREMSDDNVKNIVRAYVSVNEPSGAEHVLNAKYRESGRSYISLMNMVMQSFVEKGDRLNFLRFAKELRNRKDCTLNARSYLIFVDGLRKFNLDFYEADFLMRSLIEIRWDFQKELVSSYSSFSPSSVGKGGLSNWMYTLRLSSSELDKEIADNMCFMASSAGNAKSVSAQVERLHERNVLNSTTFERIYMGLCNIDPFVSKIHFAKYMGLMNSYNIMVNEGLADALVKCAGEIRDSKLFSIVDDLVESSGVPKPLSFYMYKFALDVSSGIHNTDSHLVPLRFENAIDASFFIPAVDVCRSTKCMNTVNYILKRMINMGISPNDEFGGILIETFMEWNEPRMAFQVLRRLKKHCSKSETDLYRDIFKYCGNVDYDELSSQSSLVAESALESGIGSATSALYMSLPDHGEGMEEMPSENYSLDFIVEEAQKYGSVSSASWMKHLVKSRNSVQLKEILSAVEGKFRGISETRTSLLNLFSVLRQLGDSKNVGFLLEYMNDENILDFSSAVVYSENLPWKVTERVHSAEELSTDSWTLSTFNHRLLCHSQKGEKEKCIELFRAVKGTEVVPDKMSYSSLILSCWKSRDVAFGLSVFEAVLRHSVVKEPLLFETILELFEKTGFHDHDFMREFALSMYTEGLPVSDVCFSMIVRLLGQNDPIFCLERAKDFISAGYIPSRDTLCDLAGQLAHSDKEFDAAEELATIILESGVENPVATLTSVFEKFAVESPQKASAILRGWYVHLPGSTFVIFFENLVQSLRSAGENNPIRNEAFYGLLDATEETDMAYLGEEVWKNVLSLCLEKYHYGSFSAFLKGLSMVEDAVHNELDLSTSAIEMAIEFCTQTSRYDTLGRVLEMALAQEKDIESASCVVQKAIDLQKLGKSYEGLPWKSSRAIANTKRVCLYGMCRSTMPPLPFVVSEEKNDPEQELVMGKKF
eukprot:Nk52_evm14s360 gene=Nk52_evmTU14s360